MANAFTFQDAWDSFVHGGTMEPMTNLNSMWPMNIDPAMDTTGSAGMNIATTQPQQTTGQQGQQQQQGQGQNGFSQAGNLIF